MSAVEASVRTDSEGPEKDRPHENPFFLPLHLTGLDHPETMLRGMAIGSLALLTVAAVIVAGQAVGLLRVPVWQLLADAAFLLVRTPRTAHTARLQIQASEWGSLLWLAGLLCFASLAGGQLTKASEMMARNLSLGDDDYKFNKKDSKRAVLVPRYLFVLFLLGGGALWIHLTREGDALLLRLVRLISIGLFVQLGTLLAGGAMACALAEGHSGLEALGRMLRLAWRAKGDLMRAVIYTLPRWCVRSFLAWGIAAAGVLLPFVLAGALMGPYLPFLKGQGSWSIRAGLVSVGVFVVVGWWWLWREKLRDPVMRFITVGMLPGIVCSLVALPLLHADPRQGLVPWFDTSLEYLAGWSSGTLPSGEEGGLILPGLLTLFLAVAPLLGMFAFLFPLAVGTCTFFTLREAVEGNPYRRSSGITGATTPVSLSMTATQLFPPSGQTTIGELHAPRGWRPLVYLALRPVPLLLSSIAAAVVVAAAEFGASGPVLGLIIAAVLVVCLPLLCRQIAPILEARVLAEPYEACSISRDYVGGGLALKLNDTRLGPEWMPLVQVGVWLYVVLPLTLITVGIGLSGPVGLIPAVGPLLWGVLYWALFAGAVRVAAGLIFWIADALLLPPVIACEIVPGGNVTAVLARVSDYSVPPLKTCRLMMNLLRGVSMAVMVRMHHYASKARWTFLGAAATGLVFAMLPALVCAVAVSLLGRWSTGTRILTGGLALLGLASALTNAYLAIRKLIEAREEAKARQQAQLAPLRVGDTVVLGRHWPVDGKDNWNPLMDQYVGKKARVTALPGNKDQAGCDVVQVDVDGGRFPWRVQNLTRV